MNGRQDLPVTVNLKVYYTLGDLKCLARGGSVTVHRLAAGSDVAIVGLRTCVQAVANASPELIGDKACDYSIYALDATETDADLFEGHGLLSWALTTSSSDPKVVSGRLKPSLSGQMFEVRIKLTRVGNVSQVDFLATMAFYERVSHGLPPNFDFSGWQETCKNAISVMRAGTSTICAPSAAPIIETTTATPATPPLVAGVNGYLPSTTAGLTAAIGNVAASRSKLPASHALAGKPSRTQSSMTTLQKAREMANRQSTQSMSLQLEHARQQQRISSQQQAQLQALAPQASHSPQLPSNGSPSHLKVSATGSSHLNILSPANTDGDVASPMQRSASSQSLHSSSQPAELNVQTTSQRGTKRKASGVEHTASTGRSRPAPSATTSVAAAQAAAMNAAAAVKPPLQKSQSDTTGVAPAQTTAKKTSAGKQARYCQNCRVAQPKGSWKLISVSGVKTVLCSACGSYWKSHGQMRPHAMLGAKSASSIYQQSRDGGSSAAEDGNDDSSSAAAIPFPRTSPMRSDADRSRAVQSSPVRPTSSRRPCTPDRALAEISVNTPRPQTPSLSLSATAAAATDLLDARNVDDLLALLQTPKKQFEASALRTGVSPSPWKAMFTSIPEDSPSRFKLDKFLEELGMSATAGQAGDVSGASPGLGGLKFDFEDGTIGSALLASPSKFDLAALMSSPPSMGLFTSEDIQVDESATPPTGNVSATFDNEDSLFTPRSSAHVGLTPATIGKVQVTREGSPSLGSTESPTDGLMLPTAGAPETTQRSVTATAS